MFTTETGLIRKVPIVEHSSIKEAELAAVLLAVWSRYQVEPHVTERWVQQTCNYLATLRELIGSDDTNVAVFVVRGLVSEVRHLEESTLLRLLDEVIERKHLGSLLNVLGLKDEPCRTHACILGALSKGLVVEFNSIELQALKLREVDARNLASLMLLVGVNDDGAVDAEDLESCLRDWAERKTTTYNPDMGFDLESLKELLHLNCELTIRQLKHMSEEHQLELRKYTTMNTITEVYAKVKLRKEILFDEEELADVEPDVPTYPSLTMEGVIVGKTVAYTLGRIPLEERKDVLVRRLASIQKERSILLFSTPGKYDITPSECIRLSDFSSRFIFDVIHRLAPEDAQQRLLSLIDEVGLLEQV